MRTLVCASLAAVMAFGLSGCRKSPTEPGDASKASALTLTGAAGATAIGQTVQLTATATFAGEPARDVTGEVEWSSLQPAVTTVSASGLVTVVGYGLSNISAKYRSLYTTKRVDAFPPIRSISLTGNTSLSGVGETSQLQVTATMFTGATEDVTKYATWSLETIPAVASVSDGLLKAQALGWGSINVYVFNADRGVRFPVSVTPPGTYYVWGFAYLPHHPAHDTGSGVGGLRVVDSNSGRTTTTNFPGFFGPGWYSMGGLAGTARLMFDATGFETAELLVTGPPVNPVNDGGGSVKIQPLHRITTGATLQTTIWPDDMEYHVSPSGPCTNCRLIRIVNPSPGTLHLNLTWDQPTISLSIWANGTLFAGTPGEPLVADVPAGAGELVLYVGAGNVDLGNGVTMTLKTSLMAPGLGAPTTMFRRD